MSVLGNSKSIPQMEIKRSRLWIYRIAKKGSAVELIGRRWSGAIISVMMGRLQCFNELLAAVPGLSDRLLTERLRELKSEGIVRRMVIAGPPVRVSYELTEAGESLKPVIESLGRWAEQWVKV